MSSTVDLIPTLMDLVGGNLEDYNNWYVSKKAKEAKCGEGKCGEGKKAKEGKCGEGKAKKEGKCGEGKCGGKN